MRVISEIDVYVHRAGNLGQRLQIILVDNPLGLLTHPHYAVAVTLGGVFQVGGFATNRRVRLRGCWY